MVTLKALVIMVVVLHFLSCLTTSTSNTKTNKNTTSATYSAHYQDFNVQETLTAIKTMSSKPSHYQELSKNDDACSKLKLKLVNRDVISMSNFSNHRHRFNNIMKIDITRVRSLSRRLNHGGGGGGYKVNDFGSDVISGMEQGSGEYFVRIGVGSPARDQYMVIDSGSDIVCVQCQPCSQCYKQSSPVFDP